MADLKFGSTSLKQVYFGNKLCSSIYYNGQKIWTLERQLKYRLANDSSHYVVIGRGTIAGDTIIIPSTYQGKPVRGIEAQAFKGDSLTTLKIVGNNLLYVTNNAFENTAITKVEVDSLEAWLNIGFGTLTSNPIASSAADCQLYVNGTLISGTLTIPAGITEIKKYAFYNYKFIDALDLTYDVTTIQLNAFYGSHIQTVYAKNTLTSIQENGLPDEVLDVYFEGSSHTEWYSLFSTSRSDNFSLVPVALNYTPDSSNSYNIVSVTEASKTATDLTCMPFYHGLPVTHIADEGFRGCSNLVAFLYPSSITHIGNRAFYYCGRLNSFRRIRTSTTFDCDITNTIRSIGTNSFENTALTTLSIAMPVDEIPQYAFAEMINVVSVTISGSYIRNIGNSAFAGSTKLAQVNIDSQTPLEYIGPFAFLASASALRINHARQAIVSIGEEAFRSRTGTTTVTLPTTWQLKDVGYEAFASANLTNSSLIFNGTTSIGHRAFYYNSNLTSIKFVNCIDPLTIESSAFAHSGITSAKLPGEWTSFAANAFSTCPLTGTFECPQLIWRDSSNKYYQYYRSDYYMSEALRKWPENDPTILFPAFISGGLTVSTSYDYNTKLMTITISNRWNSVPLQACVDGRQYSSEGAQNIRTRFVNMPAMGVGYAYLDAYDRDANQVQLDYASIKVNFTGASDNYAEVVYANGYHVHPNNDTTSGNDIDLGLQPAEVDA